MNYTELFQKLVDLLGTSEFDLNLQKIFTDLGEKFPLKRPKSDETGYLLEDNKKKNRGFHLGVEYAETLPHLKDNTSYKEGELIFYSIQNIDKSKFEDTIFPFEISWSLTPETAKELLGNFFDYDEFWNAYLWEKENIIIILEFNDNNVLENICFRVVVNDDLVFINI